MTHKHYPSQDSSIGSILAWYRGGPGFKSRKEQEFFSSSGVFCRVIFTSIIICLNLTVKLAV